MTNTQIATLPPTERAVAALGFDTVKAEVEKLATQYADITAISNKAGRDQAHSAATALKSKRVEIQKRAKEVREDAVAFQKAVIAKGDELAAIIEPEEQRLIGLRDAWDEEQARIKREAAEAEQRRKAWHESQVASIRGVVLNAAGAAPAALSTTPRMLATWLSCHALRRCSASAASRLMRACSSSHASRNAISRFSSGSTIAISRLSSAITAFEKALASSRACFPASAILVRSWRSAIAAPCT